MTSKTRVLALIIFTAFFSDLALSEIVWGMPPTHIVVSEQAPEQDQIAAKEFQRLYKLRTGTELKIYSQAGHKGVLIGRTTLREYPPVPPASDTPGLQIGRGEDREHYIQKALRFNFDDLEPGGFAYMATGWVMDYKLLIAGKTPEDTIAAVYDFCERHLGVKRLDSGEFVASEEPVKDWGAAKRVTGLRREGNADSPSSTKAGLAETAETAGSPSDSKSQN
ncbi:MAG: hypothetical protein KJ060_11445 [Candidatus Hydrogenedentes bacterium]|nr:hypothetical protein [Candidatus Hydrogenedentota bacterium]